MNRGFLQRLYPHLLSILVLLIVAVLFCSPALSGKVVSQSDVVQWKGMAQQSFEFKERYGHFPLWTNSMFGGMPAFQIAFESDNAISTGYFHYLFSLFLPKPINFFFLASVLFYFLCQVFRIRPWIAVLASIGYAYATYNSVIIAVGHDTKMLTMAYMPALLGALVLLYEKKYWLGGALTALFSALMIGMNHLQVTYYFLLTAFFMTVVYLYRWIKAKEFRHMALALGIAAVAGVAGVLANATNIFVTYDYSKATMRNGTLGLDTAAANGTKKAGLPIDYAFHYGSYGRAETLTFLFPALYGGSSSGELDGDSKVAGDLREKGVGEEQAEQFAKAMPAYWGSQPGHAGPVYLGAVFCFLFILGMVLLKTDHRWWMLAAILLAVLMSWGKNLEGFNTFLFNHLPLYNKFRAPAIILVIPQLCLPLLSAMALQNLFFDNESREEKWKKFRLATYITGGLLFVGVLLYFSFSYKGPTDDYVQQMLQQNTGGNQQMAAELYTALKDDRKALFGGDLLRSIVLIALAAGLLGLYLRNKLKYTYAIAGLIFLTLFDLLGVGKRYLNEDDFVEPDQYDGYFNPSPANLQIKQDTSYYRVLNLTQDVFNDAFTSYHHNSVGGYHPAKLSITEDLLTYQLRKQPMNVQVLNMLNTKYIITPDQQSGQPAVQINPEALGPAWFVKAVRYENNWLAVMNALNNFSPRDTAVLEASSRTSVNAVPVPDSAANIQLIRNVNDDIVYQSNSTTGGFAVFSEIFYDRGWKAYIDNKEAPIIRTNYVLRGLNVPAGKHEIRFEFRPASYKTGETVSLIANIIIWLFLLFAAYQVYRHEKNRDAKATVVDKK